MGIPHGGNVVLYYQIFNPNKIVAIEHALEPVEPLPRYIAKHRKAKIIKPYYGINQADHSAMETILSTEFPNRDVDIRMLISLLTMRHICTRELAKPSPSVFLI